MRVFRILFLFSAVALTLSMAACDDERYWAKNFEKTDKTVLGFATIPTSDGGYLNLNNHWTWGGDDEPYVIKLDEAGDIQWQKNYSTGIEWDSFYRAVESNGSYILIGYTKNFSGINNAAWVVKINSDGSVIEWEKLYYIDGVDLFPKAIVPSSNGGFTLLGTEALVEIDSSGIPLWHKSWDETNLRATAMTKTSDGYVILGNNAEVMKLDTSGNFQWAKTYTFLNGTVSINGDSTGAIVETSDNGFLIIGTYKDLATEKRDMWVQKISNTGTRLWEKMYSNTLGTDGTCIDASSDGTFIAAGSFQKTDQDNYAWILKLDGSGSPMWQRGTNEPAKSILSVETTPIGSVLTGYNTYETGGVTHSSSAVMTIDGDGLIPGAGFNYEDTSVSIYSISPAVTGITVTLGSGIINVTDTHAVVQDVIFQVTDF